MGNQQSGIIFDEAQWDIIDETRFSSVIRHRATLEQLQRFQLTFVGGSISKTDEQIYRVRRSGKNKWVPVLHHFSNRMGVLCGQKGTHSVITPRITRLSQLNRQLTREEGFAYLGQAIEGFGSLVSHFGYFNITKNMIGFDQRGYLKVWLNENFASNQKSRDQCQKLDCQTLIRVITRLICQKVKDCDFSDVFEHRQRLNFAKATLLLASYRNRNMGYESKRTCRRQHNMEQSGKKKIDVDETSQLTKTIDKSKKENEIPSNTMLVKKEQYQVPIIRMKTSKSMRQPISKAFLKLHESVITEITEVSEPRYSQTTKQSKKTQVRNNSTADNLNPMDFQIFKANLYQDQETNKVQKKIERPSIGRLGLKNNLSHKLLTLKDVTSMKSLKMQKFQDIRKIDSVVVLGNIPSESAIQDKQIVLQSVILRS